MIVKNGNSLKLINLSLSIKCKNHKMHKIKNNKMSKNDQKTSKIGGGLISALKPGPVVPPGIEKVPNQAARKTQSVKKCHLSDILAFFRGGHFFTLFCHFFTFLILLILHFSDFLFFWFYHFLCFSLFPVFWFWWFCWFFCHFLCLGWFLITFCH